MYYQFPSMRPQSPERFAQNPVQRQSVFWSTGLLVVEAIRLKVDDLKTAQQCEIA